MRMKNLIVTIASLIVGCYSYADNLSFNTTDILIGKAKEVSVLLNNPSASYAAFQFDMVMPEGVTIAKDDNGKYVTSLNENRADDHTLTLREVSSGTYRFLSYSLPDHSGRVRQLWCNSSHSSRHNSFYN